MPKFTPGLFGAKFLTNGKQIFHGFSIVFHFKKPLERDDFHFNLFSTLRDLEITFERVKLASVLSSVFSCLEIVMNHSRSFLK